MTSNNMHKFVILLAIISSAICQYLQQPQLRTNYQTDHSARQEVINANGDYEGEYSYQDPTGSRVVVKYNAGKNGFNVIGEDKIPQQPQQYQQQPQQQQGQSYIQPQIPQSRYYQPQAPLHYPRTLPSYEPSPVNIPQAHQPETEDLYQQFQQQLYTQEPAQAQAQAQQSYHQAAAQAQQLYPQAQAQAQQLYPQAAAQTHQPQTVYQPQPQPQPQEEYQPKFTQALFTAAQNPFPAATAGQTKSYYEYLEEEQKEANAVSTEKSGSTARAHVSVQNSNHQGYSYNIQL